MLGKLNALTSPFCPLNSDWGIIYFTTQGTAVGHWWNWREKTGATAISSLFDSPFGHSFELPNVGLAIGLGLHQHPKLFITVDQLDGVVV